MKVQIERFHLNGHTKGFRPQTQKLKLPYKTQLFTLAVKGLNRSHSVPSNIQTPIEEFKVFESRKEDCVMFDVASKMINNLNLNFANC